MKRKPAFAEANEKVVADFRRAQIAFLDCGGKTYRVEMYGKVFYIEMHPQMGPVPVDKDGNGLSRTPRGFWQAYDALMKLPQVQRDRYEI